MSEPAATVKSFCRFCEALCGIEVTVDGDRVLSVRGDRSDPLSSGYTCPKGRSLPAWHHRPDRLDHPAIRDGADLVETTWDEAMADLAARLEDIVDRHGRDAVGFYLATGVAFDSMGRRTAERLQRALGTKSKYTATTIDTPNKLLVSEMMSGFPGLVPAPDRKAGTLFGFFGTNPVVSHGHLNAFPDPVVTIREMARDAEVWVVDPRRSETARLADRHLQIKAGSDFALLAFLVRDLLDDGADADYLSAHADGATALRQAVDPWTAPAAAARTGLAVAELEELADRIRAHGRIAFQSGTGVSMSPTANVAEWLLWCLHIVTGSFDREGGMWFHPGYLKRFDTRVRPADTTAARPGPGPSSRADIPGRWGEIPCAAMADEIESGNLRALIVLGGNPPRSFPDTERITAALGALEVLAVADVVETDTTRLATHVLPVAGQMERADLSLNLDQFMPNVSVRYTPAVVAPAAQRRPLWRVMCDLADRMGIGVLPAGVDGPSATDDDLLAPIADRSRSSFDLVRRERVHIDAEAAFGWVTENVLPDGKWQVAPPGLVAQLAAAGEPGPIVLIPRRQVRHLNSQMAGEAPPSDDADLLIHPDDAAAAGVRDGRPVRVVGVSGSVVATARVVEAIAAGSVSLPHGYGDPNVGRLTTSRTDLDPLTGMPVQSGLPVTLEAVDA